MEYINIKNKEILQKFNEWWGTSFNGNLPIYHPSDLDNFAELIKATYNKQDVLNPPKLRDFLYEQMEKGNLKKGQEPEIDLAVALYSFGVNNMSKFF